jgi:mono/diheme cytochrome c family protein
MGRTMGGFPRTWKRGLKMAETPGLDRDQGGRRAGGGGSGQGGRSRCVQSFVFGRLALASPLAAQEAEVGAALYADFCAVCHGAGATG